MVLIEIGTDIGGIPADPYSTPVPDVRVGPGGIAVLTRCEDDGKVDLQGWRMIVALAVASQFLSTPWVRLGLPLFALLTIAIFIWQASVEWRLVKRHLQAAVLVEIDESHTA